MNIVKELRERAVMQQKELAIAVGVSRPTVSEWEHQKKDPSGDRLQKLAELFNVEPGIILGYKNDLGAGVMTDEDKELWEAREAARRDPQRRILFSLAKNGSEKDIKQAVALIDALRATNPDFYKEGD